MADPLLQVEALRTYLDLAEGTLRAVDGVSFTLEAGQTLALVGESGSGKTMVALSILRLLPERARLVGGQILFSPDGGPAVDLARLPPDGRAMRAIRGARIGMIFQEPMTSLSPVHTIGEQIGEVARLHLGLGRRAARQRTVEMLRAVGFPDPARGVDAYPFELSGGLRQRAMIAMALICRPALLIADEPTSALDVTVQAQILTLLRELQQESGLAILLITHDPGVVAHMADTVTVLYRGRVMEAGPVECLFTAPRHPYLQALLRSIPQFGLGPEERLQAIPGTAPGPLAELRGCPFFGRCPEGEPDPCGERTPELVAVEPDHPVACHHRLPGGGP